MKAALFRGPGQPLDVTEVATPKPGPGEALVRVAGCGMCHTDLHYLDHGVKTFKLPPLILGHEAAGIVETLNDGASGIAVGDRVLIPAVLSCGHCGYCRRGRENLCDNMVMPGNNIDGAYAEFIVVPADQLIPLPQSFDLKQACVIADAISTPYHAVKHRGRVQAGDSVAVVGENRKLLIFPLSELPEMTRGRGNMLQRYKDGELSDVCVFTLADGLTWRSGGRTRAETDLDAWIGKRAQAGRIAPRGFPRSNRFA